MRKSKSIRLLGGVEEQKYGWFVNLRVTGEGGIKELQTITSFVHVDFRDARERALFWKIRKSSCICLECGELDFRCLQEHHVDKEKMSDFKICLCANCHAKLHWNIGKRKI